MNAFAQIETVELVEIDAEATQAAGELNELELAFVGGGTGDVCF